MSLGELIGRGQHKSIYEVHGNREFIAALYPAASRSSTGPFETSTAYEVYMLISKVQGSVDTEEWLRKGLEGILAIHSIGDFVEFPPTPYTDPPVNSIFQIVYYERMSGDVTSPKFTREQHKLGQQGLNEVTVYSLTSIRNILELVSRTILALRRISVFHGDVTLSNILYRLDSDGMKFKLGDLDESAIIPENNRDRFTEYTQALETEKRKFRNLVIDLLLSRLEMHYRIGDRPLEFLRRYYGEDIANRITQLTRLNDTDYISFTEFLLRRLRQLN